jgi:hypothetical protein
MRNTNFTDSHKSVYARMLKNYKECLKTDSCLSFKSYCRDNNIKYENTLVWMNRRGISVKQLQAKMGIGGPIQSNKPPTLYPVQGAESSQ